MMLVLLLTVAALGLTQAAPSASQIQAEPQWGRAPNEFPEDFYLGAATSSYQIEGGWDADGKGLSMWDFLLHQRPNLTADGKNGDVAADSYHNYKEDVKALVGLNANVYRFSINWPRILPTGDVDNINQPGIDYYNNLIDELLANGITPMATIYHWELPHELQKLGGWTNLQLVDYFVNYARVLFSNFGDRVKMWLTFNEPNIFSKGYSSPTFLAPCLNSSGIADYMLSKTVLLAHARVYELYNAQFRWKQKGRVGITLDAAWYEPLTSSEDDALASERQLQFEVGLWANPIFTRKGDYPEIVKERVAANSKAEGRTRSRLPTLSRDEIRLIRGSADFFGVNHYTSSAITSGSTGVIPSKEYDAGVATSVISGDYPSSGWIYDIPWGLRKLLNWIHDSYPGYPIFVTENGWSDTYEEFNDTGRIHYYKGYLSAILKAINEDGVPVIGYTAWSLIDNLEWMNGYTLKFGIYNVDYEDDARPRREKASVQVISQIYRERAVPWEDYVSADTTPPS